MTSIKMKPLFLALNLAILGAASASASEINCVLQGPDGPNPQTLIKGTAKLADATSRNGSESSTFHRELRLEGVNGTLYLTINSGYVAGNPPQLDVGAFFYAKADENKPGHPYSKIAVRAEAAPVINSYKSPYDSYTHRLWVAGMGGTITCEMNIE